MIAETGYGPSIGNGLPVLKMAGQKGKNMKQYKEIRKITASSLRQLCIDRDWYTAGDNDEYEHLLFDLADKKENLTTADIIEIAADIMAHSDLDDGCTIENIAFEVASIANVFFEEYEAVEKKEDSNMKAYMENGIENIMKTLSWKEYDLERSQQYLASKASIYSVKDIAHGRLDDHINEIRRQYEEVKSLRDQIETLEHLLKKAE